MTRWAPIVCGEKKLTVEFLDFPLEVLTFELGLPRSDHRHGGTVHEMSDEGAYAPELQDCEQVVCERLSCHGTEDKLWKVKRSLES